MKPFPSAWSSPSPLSVQAEQSAYLDRVELLQESGVEALFLGVGVDRVDYTKGILERFLAIERMLEKYPVYQEKFTFVQIGAPSRTHIKRYHDFLADVTGRIRTHQLAISNRQMEADCLPEPAA